MARDMAADVHGGGQSRDMGGRGLDIDAQRRGFAAEALRSDTQGVDALEQRALHIGVKRIRVALGNRAAKRFFSKVGAILEIAAEAHADVWITAGVLSSVFTRASGSRTTDLRKSPSV